MKTCENANYIQFYRTEKVWYYLSTYVLVSKLGYRFTCTSSLLVDSGRERLEERLGKGGLSSLCLSFSLFLFLSRSQNLSLYLLIYRVGRLGQSSLYLSASLPFLPFLLLSSSSSSFFFFLLFLLFLLSLLFLLFTLYDTI